MRAGPGGFDSTADGMRSEREGMRPGEVGERAGRRFSVPRSDKMSTFPTDTSSTAAAELLPLDQFPVICNQELDGLASPSPPIPQSGAPLHDPGRRARRGRPAGPV